MKNKLIAAMLALTFHINGMDEMQPLESPGSYPNPPMELEEDSSFEDAPPLGSGLLQDRVDELNEYYQSESKLEANKALQDLNKVFDEDTRKLYFEEFVLEINGITNDQAMEKYTSEVSKEITT